MYDEYPTTVLGSKNDIIGLKMSIKFLKGSPDDAVCEINNLIESGYEIKIDFDTEYKKLREGGSVKDNHRVESLISRYSDKANKWFNQALQTLEQIYVNKRNMYEFQEAKCNEIRLLSDNDSEKWDSLTRNLQAKIEKLIQYDDFIKREFRIENVYGDKVEGNKYQQNGHKNTQQILKSG